MSGFGANLKSWIARNRYSRLVRYGSAALAVWVALSLWTFSPVLHRHLFVLLLAAVLFTARFLGFGASVFCSLVSTACLDFFAVPPYFSFGIHRPSDLERLLVFLAISVFAASMARQKTLAESRANRTRHEMATIVERSEEAIRRNEKLATAGRFAASIAHEINNPLEAITNLLYLARHDSGHAGEYLSLAEKEVGRVARLAQQALGLVRDAGSPGTMDPAAIIDEILELYSRKLESRKIRVERRYRSTCEVSGYSGELRQLLANLLVNAVDAMTDGGSLRIRVATGHDWASGRAGIRITFADNGSGISRNNLRQIFEPFYTTKKGTGTGLGLWVSQGIVHKHGGSIRLRSRAEGRATGTVFSIFLPKYQAMSQAA